MNVREVLRAIRDQSRYVLVVGLGISGIEAVKFFQRAGIYVRAVEREDRESFFAKSKFSAQVQTLLDQGVELHFGVDGEGVRHHLNQVSLCVLSPGVPLESAIVGSLKHHAIAVISELELGIELLGVPCIVVTGSNGKSTTVSLIHDMLFRSGFNSTLCGNVGVPVIAGVPGAVLDRSFADEKSVLVVEASSYQIESCAVLRPKIGLLLNISENHLERHGTMERYLAIKARIFQNQKEDDYALLGFDDGKVAALAPKMKAPCVGFGGEEERLKDLRAYGSFSFESGTDRLTLALTSGSEIYDLSRTKLRGRHNRQNIAAAALAARLFGATKQGVEESINSFSPLEHRLETCGEIKGVTFINDSKATTVAATLAALNAILPGVKSGKVTLMIGGVSKAGSWEPVMSFLRENREILHSLVCFGQDGRLLGSHCSRAKLPFLTAATLEDGVQAAFQQSNSGDLVLLSPGCTSFDQFTDFENRGSVFKSVVAALSNDKAA